MKTPLESYKICAHLEVANCLAMLCNFLGDVCKINTKNSSRRLRIWWTGPHWRSRNCCLENWWVASGMIVLLHVVHFVIVKLFSTMVFRPFNSTIILLCQVCSYWHRPRFLLTLARYKIGISVVFQLTKDVLGTISRPSEYLLYAWYVFYFLDFVVNGVFEIVMRTVNRRTWRNWELDSLVRTWRFDTVSNVRGAWILWLMDTVLKTPFLPLLASFVILSISKEAVARGCFLLKF